MSVGTIGIIGGTMVGSPAEPAESWTRPAEWPAVPESQANELHGIVAVYDVPLGAIIAFSVTVAGGYTVDWGDGTVDNVASGVTAEHIYDYDNVNLPAALADGSKLAVVSVYSTTPGAAWTAVNLTKRHSSLLRDAIQAWLEWDLNAPFLTSDPYLSSGMFGPTVRNVRLISPRLSSMALYNNYGSLENLYADFLDSSAPNLGYLTYNCASLKRVRLYGTGNISNFSAAFSGCITLVDINSPLDTASATNMSYMFSSAASLNVVPDMDLSNTTTVQGFLRGTAIIEQPVLNFPATTRADSLFEGCRLLTRVDVATSNAASVAAQNPSLAVLRVGGQPTSISSLAYQSGSVLDIEVYDASLVTSTSLMLTSGKALQRLILTGITVSFTCESQNMSAAALNDLFTSLGTAVGQTVTVKGNPGAATCDTSIATAKGWTVVTT